MKNLKKFKQFESSDLPPQDPHYTEFKDRSAIYAPYKQPKVEDDGKTYRFEPSTDTTIILSHLKNYNTRIWAGLSKIQWTLRIAKYTAKDTVNGGENGPPGMLFALGKCDRFQLDLLKTATAENRMDNIRDFAELIKSESKSIIGGFVAIGEGEGFMTRSKFDSLFREGVFENLDDSIVIKCLNHFARYRDPNFRKSFGKDFDFERMSEPQQVTLTLLNHIKEVTIHNFEAYLRRVCVNLSSRDKEKIRNKFYDKIKNAFGFRWDKGLESFLKKE